LWDTEFSLSLFGRVVNGLLFLSKFSVVLGMCPRFLRGVCHSCAMMRLFCSDGMMFLGVRLFSSHTISMGDNQSQSEGLKKRSHSNTIFTKLRVTEARMPRHVK